MRTQTRQLIIGLAPILIGLFAGGYLGFRAFGNYESTTKFTGEVIFNSGGQSDSTNNQIKPTAPSPVPTVSATPTPTATPEREIKEFADNITDHWISERSKKSYFIIETNGYVQMFETDSEQRRKEVGKGHRTENKITLLFSSTLDEVDGTLKLEVSKDGKSMTGRFSALGDPTKEGVVRMIRSAS
jgi:hypothetical protein